jgi:hypothetical protein
MPNFSPENIDPQDLRMMDAMIHHLLVGTPLVIGRGPIYNGLPVPLYTRDEGAAFGLLKACHPEARFAVSTLTGNTRCEIVDGTLARQRECGGEHPALLLTFLCLEHSICKDTGVHPDEAWDLIGTYAKAASEGDWKVAAPAPQEQPETLS